MPHAKVGLRWPLAVLALLLAATGCATRVTPVAWRDGRPDHGPRWHPLYQGVELARARTADPLQAVYGVRIDLTRPGTSFLATPGNGEKPGETDGMKTSTFLKTYHCTLAVNASPFDPVRDEEGLPTDVVGLLVSRGEVVSEPHAEFGALLITRDNRARVAAPPIDVTGVYNAVGGFNVILKQGEILGDDGDRHPRTAAGVSQDGRFLYLVIIDGRQVAYSMGATTRETARWLVWAGAWDGVNLDGGGSTCLVLAKGRDSFRLVNRPIHRGVPGRERVNGDHLGVFAEPLPGRGGPR